MVDVDVSFQGPSDPERVKQALARWLNEHWPAATGIQIHDFVTPQSSGYSNETVMFRASWHEGGQPRDKRYVLRMEPQRLPVFPLQTSVQRPSVEVQYRAMKAVADHSTVPLAPLVGYEASLTWVGAPFFVMGFVEGRVPVDVPLYTLAGFIVEEATPAQRRRVVESGLDVLAQIHRIDWTRADVDWLVPEKRAPGLRWQLDLHRDYVRAQLRGRAHPILEPALAWLEAHFPGEGALGISWGDARIGNMIFANFECAAVTDWEAVALGSAEMDLGWWLMFDRYAHESAGATRLDGMPTREEQKAYYESRAGRRLGDTRYFEILAATRFTAVMIPNGDRFTADGRVPAEMNLAIHNPGTQVLADLLEIPYRWTDPPR
jgi:aminoglycoside phosphotransferase (APT) family kinase protein